MNTDFDFNDLFVFDLANNHQGQVEHGKKIIQEMGAVTRQNKVRGVMKFQFRQLDTFIHPSHKEQSDNKHVPRFLSTRLSNDQFAVLTEEAKNNGLITMCTPFDEESVEVIIEQGIQIIKVASCSANDWPLLEKISEYNEPVIVSTGGLDWKQIDDLVSFLDHRRTHFALMHCVAIYPTPPEGLQLNQIDLMRRRYADKVVGFSTHEDPDALSPVKIAVAKGARILERHVGVVTDQIKLNAYSSTPAQVDAWIKAALESQQMCGAAERPPAPVVELESLESLKRGIFARTSLKKGATVQRDEVYFALPMNAGQLSSGEWKEGIVLKRELGADAPLLSDGLKMPAIPKKQALITAIHTIKGMLNEANIKLSTEFELEFSHHYGIDKFSEFGATIIDCVNRSYCKKLIVQMPGQRHPSHYHKRKEETFQVLYGTLELEIEGRQRTLVPGDIQMVQQGVWHEFWTDSGVIFEEISTTHFNDDSFYEDKDINQIERSERKTVVNQWGRYQI